MSEQRIVNLLSMAQRAGRVASGAFAVEEAVKKGKADFLMIAADAQQETKRKFEELADRYDVPVAHLLTRDALGACLGKEYRAVAALLDTGFAKRLQELLKEQG